MKILTAFAIEYLLGCDESQTCLMPEVKSSTKVAFIGCLKVVAIDIR
jgi:hypothetical protein